MQKFVYPLATALMVSLLCLPLFATAQSTADASADSAETNELPLHDLRLFSLIFDHIRRSYVEPISDQQLLENAIKGMLQEMDPHSAYLDASSFSQIQRSTQGKFSGVGIEIGNDNGFIKIITPIDGTPAQKAGLQAGDLIIKLDQQSTQGYSLDQASEQIRGPIGSSITFTIVREGIEAPFDITIVRDTIKSLSVRHRIIDNAIAYIRISQFQASTGNDFAQILKQLHAEQDDVSGLILDLRNNPGGVLQASVQVVDSVLNDGLIVYTRGRLDTSNVDFEATTGDESHGLPIVVLVNGGSASASEIVAGALQDHKRAVIMGTKTFGKGSVQTILPVSEDKGIKLTTARYFTPTGRSIQAQGIQPDIIVKPATITAIKAGQYITEADLGKHLKNTGNNKKPSEKNNANTTLDDNTNDNQLFEAINLLKGLAILNQRKDNKDK